MKIKISTLFILFIMSFNGISQDEPQLMMQGWYWDFTKPENSMGNPATEETWAKNLNRKTEELANAGFTYLWLPPTSRTSSGEFSNGYDPKDLYDLGEYGLGATRFGFRRDVDQLIGTLLKNGINAVADVVYNHRDGGDWEDNPAVEDYILNYPNNSNCSGMTPYPVNGKVRYRIPLGGTSGFGAGDYFIKFGSSSGISGFNGRQYKLYAQTSVVGFKNQPAINESEPNGGGGCAGGSTMLPLGIDLIATEEAGSTGCDFIDEFQLTITSDDFNTAGDFIEIYINQDGGDGTGIDTRPYELYVPGSNENKINDIAIQTTTDFSNMPSGQGSMNYTNFKPASSPNTGPYETCLTSDEDKPLFFFDTEDDEPTTIAAYKEWSRWLLQDVKYGGLRMDAVKHFSPNLVAEVLNSLNAQGINPGMVVGEHLTYNAGTLKTWTDQVYSRMTPSASENINVRVFDFELRQALKEASDLFGNDVRNIFDKGIVNAASGSPFNTVTFLNNHDLRHTPETEDGSSNFKYNLEDPILNDPILGYAYILTNNQIGLPTVFYPDYFGADETVGYPINQPALKDEIDELWAVHKKYIAGSSEIDYLSKASEVYDDNASYISGEHKTTLLYQIRSNNINKSIIVAINYSGNSLKVDHTINTLGGAIPENTVFTDVLQNSEFNQARVDGNGQVYISLPPRSYSVWVQGDVCPITNVINKTTGLAEGIFECEDEGWTNYYANKVGENNFNSFELLFSVEKADSGVEIEKNNVENGVEGTDAIDLSEAPYVTSGGDWYVSPRYWSVTPAKQPNKPVKVRYYFTQSDLDALNNSPAMFDGNLDNLAFYKITNGKNPAPSSGHTNVQPADYTEYLDQDYTITFDNGVYTAEFIIDQFSGGGVGAGNAQGGGALPVSLTYFNAEKNNDIVTLKWQTATEQNNRGFEIEKSIDGRNFNSIGFVHGNNNSTIIRNYQFTDTDFIQDAYYRLKQLDFDDQFDFSSIIFVEQETSRSEFELLQSNTNQFQLLAPKQFKENGLSQITIYNVNGQSLYGFTSISELNRQLQTAPTWKKGVYYLSLIYNNKQTSLAITIK